MRIGSTNHLAIIILFIIFATDIVMASCPYNCTNNGACQGDTCICYSGWTGKYCQYGIYSLPIGSPITVNTTVNSTWAYFQTSFHGSSVSELIVIVTANTSFPEQTGLFAAYNYVPTYSQYDFYGQVSNNTMHLVVEIPRTGDWFFAVRGANMTFTISANIKTLCPNNCSTHGVCQSNGQCKCIPGWDTYNDCSREFSSLQLGGSVHDLTVYHAFNYYQLSVPSGDTLTIQLTIDNVHRFDMDGTSSYSLFASISEYPTLNTYDFVSRAVGTNTFTIRIEKPSSTTYMIGVWGHSLFNYTLTAFNNVTCPNNCNGNGVCLETAICKCNEFWSQEDCSLYRQLMTAGSTVQGSIPKKGIKFYSVVVTDFQKTVEFDFNINADSIGINPNIVIVYQYDELPYLLRYAKKVECNTNCSLLIENAPMGNHVIGVINQGSSSMPLNYTLSANVNVDCPNNCSSHGQCIKSACQCDQWYQTADCSLYVEALASFSTSQQNTVSQGQWRFYVLNVTTSTFLAFYIQPASLPSSNVTLPNYRVFAQFNRLPSLNNYLKATAPGLDYYQQMLIEGSANIFPGTWYFGVYGLGSSLSYTVTAYFESYCPRNCSGHGVCGDNFQCVCDPPYISDDCSSQDLPISTGVFTAGTISFDRWNYYHMSILGDDALEITVAETREDHQLGLLWVFAKKNGRPTIDDNDYRNQSDTSLLTIWIPSSSARGNWTIGVTGSPRNHGIYVERATYTLIALTGCETYTACSSCVADPNCGWCWNDLNDPNAGLCTAGDQHRSFTEKCVVYQFDTCDISVPQAAATFRGIIFGIAVGLGGLLLLGGIVLLVWRRHRLRQKQKMRPTQLLQAQKNDQNGGLLIDPLDTDSLLSGDQMGDPLNNSNSSSRKFIKKKLKPTTRIAKYGSMLDAEGYSSLSNTIGVDVHTDDEDEESSSEGEVSFITSTPKN